MTLKWHAKALVLEPIEQTSKLRPQKGMQRHSSSNPTRKQARHDFEKACNGAHAQTYEETSRLDFEKACKGARHQTYRVNKLDRTSKRHAKALVLKPNEETSMT